MAGAPTLVVEVEGIDAAEDGAAYAVVNGRRLSLDFAIPGERVAVRLPDDGGTFGQVTQVMRPSADRVTPGCPFFGPCGGCTWQHISWTGQLRLKERTLQRLLDQALGTSAPRVRPALTGSSDVSEAPWGFRNKAHFLLAPASRAGGVVLGHYRRRSQAVVAVDTCPVHDAEGNRVAFGVRDALRRAHIDGSTADGRRGVARHIVVRATRTPKETLATLVVTRNEKALRPAARGVVEAVSPDGLHVNVNDRPGPYLFGRQTFRVHGRERARERLAGVSFLISPTAFFQTNVAAAEAMVAVVLEGAGDPSTALDLYAGAGLFALPLAMRGARVTAVEDNAEAVADGEATRQFNRVGEGACRFVRARAEDLADGRVRRSVPASPDVVILDPPRAGCPPSVLDWICRSLNPPRIVYVSCNPVALATDLRVPLAAGYDAKLAQPIDMFPHTAHIETVVVLERA